MQRTRYVGMTGAVVIGIAAGAICFWFYSGVASFVLLKIVDIVMGLRVSEEDECEGLDLTLHGEAVE